MKHETPTYRPTTPPPEFQPQRHRCTEEERRQLHHLKYKNMRFKKIDADKSEWDKLIHQFRDFSGICQWTDPEQMLHILSSFSRSFSEAERASVEYCMIVLENRYGAKTPLVIGSLRSDLSVVREEEGENLETFGDRVFILIRRTYQGMTPKLIQGLAVS